VQFADDTLFARVDRVVCNVFLIGEKYKLVGNGKSAFQKYLLKMQEKKYRPRFVK
jgi:hypothetical protein